MPVVLNQPYVPTVPSYDKIHLDHLTIILERTNYAKTSISARIRPYYQDPVTGDKTFCPDAQDIYIDDADAWALGRYQEGDTRGVEAGAHIKAIVALLVDTQTNLGGASVE